MPHGSGGAPRKVAWRDKVDGALAIASMASPSGSRMMGTEAVVFSIQFYGKTIGEVGLMDQDLSELDWTKFKSYIFQNLLSVNHLENICVSYSDDEGDKLPIESEEEYREALKVAKKKAEAHDKLVLDITRQGSLPTVFSIVSSGIKRVSSSPPKEGGISFFKTASPPKESTSFGGRTIGQDKKIFPSFFSDRADGEVSGGGARPKDSGIYEQPPKWFAAYMSKFREELCEEIVNKLTHVIKEELAVTPKADQKESQELPKTDPKTLEICSLVLSYDSDTQKNCSQPTHLKANIPPSHNFLAQNDQLQDDSAAPLEYFVARRQRKSSNSQKRSSFQLGKCSLKEKNSGVESHARKIEDIVDNERRAELKLNNPQKTSSFQKIEDIINNEISDFQKIEGINNEMRAFRNIDTNNEIRAFRDIEDINNEVSAELKLNNPQKRSSFPITFPERPDEKPQDLKVLYKKKDGDAKENNKITDSGVKRKKSWREEERFNKYLEKMEEKMAKKQGKIEERFSKKHEKLEERLVKKQEKLVERFQKQQEKAEKRRSTSNSSRILEMEKSCRVQGRVLAKMEGIMKKQACTPEEFSKLRKVVDKHHKAAEKYYDDQRHLRHPDRKAGCLKAGKSKKIDDDDMAYPVDPSLLHKALLELEALAEDSPSESRNSSILGYNAFYVSDITYPDGSQVHPGTKFVKTWRVLNSGLMSWNEKTELCKWTQVQFQGSPVDWKLKPLEKKVVCPPLKPGECGNISITFIAPDEPGRYATHWRFCQQGRVFGNQIWCAVHVSDNTNSDSEGQTKFTVNKTDSEIVQASTLEENENEEKDHEEQSSTEEQSSEEDAPNSVDETKDICKTENATAEDSADSACDNIPKLQTDPNSCDEEALKQSEYEVGIVENYYDAEDPAEQDAQCGDASELEATKKLSDDLISFEEEAELVTSGSVSPDGTHTSSVALNSVMPLKDMARESVDTLKDFLKDSVVVMDEHRSHDVPSEANALDELSISSESFSDLDSDDQAILNESDTDFSDQDYFVVTMPECFNLKLPYSVVADSVYVRTNNIPEAECHDSPDFLTADEDDRTTSATIKYQDESLTSNQSTVDDNEASSHAGTVLENSHFTDTQNETLQSCQSSKVAGNSMPSLPHPPTETKGFMDIPPEALRTNLKAIALFKENSIKPEAEQGLTHQESGQANWGSGTEDRQEVVCEQPVSAQNQSKQSPSTCGAAKKNMGHGTTAAAAATSIHDQLSGDGAAALPDELVSIIPEDLVRGVWNTARTFITRINQEMLSPSANGPTRADDKDTAMSTTPPCSTQELPQKETRRKEESRTATPEAAEEQPSLPPPLQQLADMGFSNHEVNQCLLTKYNNDVACAVAELIVLNCQ